MTPVPVKVPPEFWALSALPEGYIERWIARDGAPVKIGTVLALVQVEGLVRALLAPVNGTLRVEAPANTIVDPGMQVALIQPSLDS